MCPPAGKIAGEGHRLARAAGEQVSSHRSMTSQPSVAASSRPRPGALGSLVGQKAVMAVTGVILLLFVVGHLLGNLKIFEGPAAFNAYAEGLRPVSYRRLEPIETTYAARTMRWGGVLIFLYVVYHLLDLTFGRVNPSFVPDDVYHNVVASLRVWPVAAAYIAAMVVLGLHLYHGTWSALQTLGLNPPPTHRWRRGAAAAIAVLIAGGYISIPMAVLAGVLR